MSPKEVKVRCEWLGREFLEVVDSLLPGALLALSRLRILSCTGLFTEVYGVSEALAEVVNKVMESGRVPYSAGIYLGRLRTGRPSFIPSTQLYELVITTLGRPVRAVEISMGGIKPFLYGRDVLKLSVINCYEPLGRGEPVGILTPDGRVWGIGLSSISDCSELEGLRDLDVVARNIFDIGWYLRGGTEAKERKFKL